MKFGGTSVEDANALRNVCQIIAGRVDRKPLVVMSACAGVTNALLRLSRGAAEGCLDKSLDDVSMLKKRHFRIADELLGKESAGAVKENLAPQFDDLSHLAKSIAVVGEVTPRLLDQCASLGERWSSLLLASALRERNLSTCLLDAGEIIITSDDFMRAEPLFDRIESRAREVIPPVREEVIITQGFVGATEKGITTTLGRGGSDYSAAIFGSALGAEEIQIWTDVDGMLTADPSLIPGARLISDLSFSEAAELAYFGAKVLHPSTILPAMKKNIPVRVLNSRRPNVEGTRITMQPKVQADFAVKSIAYKKGITVITIQSTRMLMAYGFLSRVFEVFKVFEKSIDVVATSEVAVSLTVDDDEDLEPIVRELGAFAEVSVERKKAVVCVVGENLKYTTGIAGRVFDALGRAGVNVELISHGGSEINLTFVISEDHILPAVESLHRELFPTPD